MFTRFNAILGAALAVIVVIGPIQDATFAIVLVANSGIGIFQEVRAKRTLDKLAVQNAAAARVVRDGNGLGDRDRARSCSTTCSSCAPATRSRATARCGVADGLEVDESLLTGESDPINKTEGDEVLSGSFVVAGSGRFQATKVGPDSYAAKLATEARRFQLTRSELMDGINTILRIVTWVLIPVSALLLWSQLQRPRRSRDALRSPWPASSRWCPRDSCCSRASRSWSPRSPWPGAQVLVQELPAVEGLARVDVVCLDKTGTLTEGEIVFDELEPLDGGDDERRQRRARRARPTTRTATPPRSRWPPHFDARRAGHAPAAVPFSSARKWSAATFDGHGIWVMGAPEMVFTDDSLAGARRGPTSSPRAAAARWCSRTATAALDGETLPADLSPVALVMFAEKVRPDAAETLAYFDEQGVDAAGDLRRQPAHRGRGRGARRARRTPSGGYRRPGAPRRPRRAWPRCSSALGVRPGHTAAEAGDGRRAAVEGPRRRHDRRRRERRAGAEGRRHRRGHGLGRARRRVPSRSSCCSTASSRPCPAWSPRVGGSSPTSSVRRTCS